MVNFIRTDVYIRWFERLRDRQARARVRLRLERLAEGNPGQVNQVGRGVSELKIDYGPGYRVYYLQRGATVVILLCGGDKSSQQHDIALAHRLADEWKKRNENG